MLGAIIGDIIGCPYEFDRGDKTKDFSLFIKGCNFTDDTVMTVAVLDGLQNAGPGADDDRVRRCIVRSMQHFGHRFPYRGYGAHFAHWLHAKTPRPYGSCGNGAAMRVSAAGWLYHDLPTVLHRARLTADVTHDHPEGIKGAQATAAAIFLARTGHSKQEIRAYITDTFGYDLRRSCDEIRPSYRHVETCQETVPEAITAFLEGQDFEDVIRTAVSLGGDCDTLTAISGSIAEAYYGIPADMQQRAVEYLPVELLHVLRKNRLPHYIEF